MIPSCGNTSRRQAQNRRIQEQHQAQAYQQLPRLREIDEEVATLSARKVRALITGQETGLDDLKNDIALLSQERSALLLSEGVSTGLSGNALYLSSLPGYRLYRQPEMLLFQESGD